LYMMAKIKPRVSKALLKKKNLEMISEYTKTTWKNSAEKSVDKADQTLLFPGPMINIETSDD